MRLLHGFTVLVVLLVAFSSTTARPLYEGQPIALGKIGENIPYATIAVHNVGKMALTVTNFGIIGTGGLTYPDPLTGTAAPSLSYPQGYDLTYLYNAALWIGAIAGNDTLVSCGAGLSEDDVYEFWPDKYPEGDIIYRSNNDPEAPEYDSSVSTQDFIAEYMDTNTYHSGRDYYTGESHRPLQVKVFQRSYAWAYDYTEDFVIFDFDIINIGELNLKDIYIGLYVNNDCGTEFSNISGDDICGFTESVNSSYIPGYRDTINVTWGADNDGDPTLSGALQGLRAPSSAIGVKLLQTPSDSINFSFNWWITDYVYPGSDWGPRKQPLTEGALRHFHGGGLGTPYTDGDKYYLMAQDEFDYNQSSTAFDHTSEGWLPPPSQADNIANGANIRYVIACGPYDFKRGDILPFTFAIVAGQDFYYKDIQTDPFAYTAYRDPTDLAMNTVWATWVFDNPGVDTDGDGYKGRYFVVVHDSLYLETSHEWIPTSAETIYYIGDGIPDFQGASPPPAPEITVSPRVAEFNEGEIEIRWNGRICETKRDQFSQRVDFEGYRVYISLSDRDEDFILVTSYDRENYDRWEYNQNMLVWEISQMPYDLITLKTMYGTNFDPLDYYDQHHLIRVYDKDLGDYTGYYFTRHDWNQSDYHDTNLIHKVYPDQPYPSTFDLDSAAMYHPDELTDEGNLKYFEYRYVLKNLLPSQWYYVSVTSFDHGFTERGLNPQETKPSANAVLALPQNNARKVEEQGLNVIVYPNPYRTDGNYEERFEGRDRPDYPAEFNRRLNFTNLPHKCTIRIFTLDGDLVREIEHNKDIDAPDAMYDYWDLISRNRMIAVSGIYYYSVDSEMGNQIGKFVIIR